MSSVPARSTAFEWQLCHGTETFCHTGGVLTKVAVVVIDEVAPFELGVICEVFGTDRGPGYPRYDFQLCSADGGPVVTKSGYPLTPHAGLGPIAEADLVAVPAHPLGTR